MVPSVRTPSRGADDLAHIVEVFLKSPRCPAQHGIDIAAAQQHRCDQRRAVAHALARQRLGHAAAAHEVIILAPAFLIPAIVFKTDDLAVATVLQAQPQGLDAGIDDVGTPHKNGSSETFVDDELRRTQHAIVFTLGQCNLLLRDLGRCEDRLHARAGMVHEARHGLPVGFEVGQRATRHAALHRGLGYRWRDALDQARIERSGD